MPDEFTSIRFHISGGIIGIVSSFLSVSISFGINVKSTTSFNNASRFVVLKSEVFLCLSFMSLKQS